MGFGAFCHASPLVVMLRDKKAVGRSKTDTVLFSL
jgi:hypothetical protein